MDSFYDFTDEFDNPAAAATGALFRPHSNPQQAMQQPSESNASSTASVAPIPIAMVS